MERYTLAELEALDTLCVSQADDLKIETPGRRVWLSRCTIGDGEPVNNKVTIEERIDGNWRETEIYGAA